MWIYTCSTSRRPHRYTVSIRIIGSCISSCNLLIILCTKATWIAIFLNFFLSTQSTRITCLGLCSVEEPMLSNGLDRSTRSLTGGRTAKMSGTRLMSFCLWLIRSRICGLMFWKLFTSKTKWKCHFCHLKIYLQAIPHLREQFSPEKSSGLLSLEFVKS